MCYFLVVTPPRCDLCGLQFLGIPFSLTLRFGSDKKQKPYSNLLGSADVVYGMVCGMKKSDEDRQFDYDVCLSFAGEQRSFVEEVACALKSKGVRVFFDDYETPELWGKDLYAHLDEVYQHLARYCILFASADYAAKVCTNHERRSAQARALKAKSEYILPARFDDTPIPGLPDTVHYIDLRRVTPVQLADLAATKLGAHERHNYLPPIPDRLFARLEIEDDEDARTHAHSQAWGFLQALRRMTPEERYVVLKSIWFGCPVDLPENVHINLDLLRRLTGISQSRLKRLLGGLRSLGFSCVVRDATAEEGRKHGQLGRSQMVELDWTDLSDDSDYPALLVAREMVVGATDGYCEEHGWPFLERLDFSQLATITATTDSHKKKAPSNRALEPTATRRKRRGSAQRR